MKRKKNQTIPGKSKPVFDRTERMVNFLPDEEEKHGFYPAMPSVPINSGKRKSQLISGFVLKGTLAVLLFLGTAILWQSEAEQFGTLKRWTSTAMNKEFPFAKVNQMYQETFGSPLSFRPHSGQTDGETTSAAIPVNGSISETFQENGQGIMIAPTGSTEINSLNSGIVVFAGNDKKTKKTVVVQHADGSLSTFGFLSSIDVHLYQYVDKDERLGNFIPGENGETVYLSIEKDNHYIDPIPVIKVDDNS
ncbi:M23 family metallopeptidase [Virgibacillus sp. 179-BFC.A HS]|uniref:M23 family metallopeptidase n=1 Tax=Tigheibacillus jepli TaxID=3035914 RepID=A0ABU5CGK4_9BACI|nr:M23 family metallopeptidase [Virgibacillus sp. 179-BFC.A HS]MDY0405453.1 M23 family metallopeptidase [Virgibacillus sp. 179-BFC.A HS]